jgi:hypothetical protein
MAGDGIHIQQRQDAHGAISPAGTDDAVNFRIGKHRFNRFARPV